MSHILAQLGGQLAATHSDDSLLRTKSSHLLFSTFDGSVYTLTIFPLLMISLLLAWFTRPRVDPNVFESEHIGPAFRKFRTQYLVVWALAISGDWLQGPYVYALYASYGFSADEISQLFVAGFGSSMLFGTFVGSLADSWGRKRCAILYCVLYILACITKHSSQYNWLMLGRILGGIATSLLMSAFECWMVAEVNERHGFGIALLRYMFSLMFLVQYLVAIACGFVAQAAADSLIMKRIPGFETLYYGGYTSPFDLSILVLLITIPVIAKTWSENYGTGSNSQSLADSVCKVVRVLKSDWRVSMIGIVVASFEGSMYAFVLNWTPALELEGIPTPPHGTIFSLFMMACMCGSSVFSFFNPEVDATHVAIGTCLVGAAALGFVALNVGDTSCVAGVFYAFLAFEACVGVYFPAIGTVKSLMVPEEARAGVYNAFRIPLNLVVCAICLTSLSLRSAFNVCSSLLFCAVLALLVILKSSSRSAPNEKNM